MVLVDSEVIMAKKTIIHEHNLIASLPTYREASIALFPFQSYMYINDLHSFSQLDTIFLSQVQDMTTPPTLHTYCFSLDGLIQSYFVALIHSKMMDLWQVW